MFFFIFLFFPLLSHILKMNISCPFPALTSANARSRTSSTGMRSTVTLVLFRLPQSWAITFTNQSSNSGRKCAHLATFNVCGLAKARGEKRKKGPSAAVPAANLRKLRREVLLPAGLVIWIPCLAKTLSSNALEKSPPAGLASQGHRVRVPNFSGYCPGADSKQNFPPFCRQLN